MGVVQIRQGAGTFITGGPPVLASEPLRFLAALHGFSRAQMFEARLVLEVAVAGLAAERAAPDKLMVISDETTGMFASLDEPDGSSITTSGSTRRWPSRRATRSSPRSSRWSPRCSTSCGTTGSTPRRTSRWRPRSTARSTRPSRTGDAERARTAMGDHLRRAAHAQSQEDIVPTESPERVNQ